MHDTPLLGLIKFLCIYVVSNEIGHGNAWYVIIYGFLQCKLRIVNNSKNLIHSFIHSFSSLSNDRSNASSKTIPPHIEIHSFLLHSIWTPSSPSSSLSDDRFKASSKTIPPHSAIQSFLLQMTVSSSVLKVIQ